MRKIFLLFSLFSLAKNYFCEDIDLLTNETIFQSEDLFEHKLKKTFYPEVFFLQDDLNIQIPNDETSSNEILNSSDIKCEENIKQKANEKFDIKKEILADKITALIFTNQTDLIEDECLRDIEGIEIDGIYVKNKEKFKNQFLCFLTKPLTLEILEQIKRKTIEYFQNNIPYLTDVKILENQDVSSGKVQILVLYAKLDEITSSGAKYFSNKRLLQKLNMQLDQDINLKEVKKYLALFNQNPFRNVSVLLEPSEDLGYTNLHFITEDIFPLKVFAGYENTGNEIASKHRFLTGLNFGNFLNLINGGE